VLPFVANVFWLQCANFVFFCQNGVDLNAVNGVGDAALHIATSNDHYKLAALLLENGAWPNVQNRRVRRPPPPSQFCCFHTIWPSAEPITWVSRSCRVFIHKGGTFFFICILHPNSTVLLPTPLLALATIGRNTIVHCIAICQRENGEAVDQVFCQRCA
jgi:ankyrin repeat protein